MNDRGGAGVKGRMDYLFDVYDIGVPAAVCIIGRTKLASPRSGRVIIIYYPHKAVNARRRVYFDGSKLRMEACDTSDAVVANTGAAEA